MNRSLQRWLAAAPMLLLGSALLAGCNSDGRGTGPPPPPPPPGPPAPPPPPGATVSLEPGELVILSDRDAVRRFKIDPGGEEYAVIVQSASDVDGSNTSMRLVAQGTDFASGSVSPAELAAAVTPIRTRPRAEIGRTGLSRDHAREWRMRVREREQIRSAAPRSGPMTSMRTTARANRVPVVGEMIELRSAIQPDGTDFCDGSTTPISTVVKAVGDHFAIIEDADVSGHLTDTDFQELLATLENIIYPVNTAYFGEPNDIDGNGRVLVMFTAQVNRLNPQGQPCCVLGFHRRIDYAAQSLCNTTNEVEVLWLLGPDPDGDHGTAISVDVVKQVMRFVGAHEHQHLINSSLRVIDGNQPQTDINRFNVLEDLWLDEGLSHFAEELAAFRQVGQSVRQNYSFADVFTTAEEQEAFILFQEDNFRNVRRYLLDPEGTPAISISDPAFAGDPEGSSKVRGFGRIFSRWIGDRFGPATPDGIIPGSNEEVLFRELVTGGPNHLFGADNIVRAVNMFGGSGMTWRDILGEYIGAPQADDNTDGELDPRASFLTWDIRDIFAGLNGDNPQDFPESYPLFPTAVGMADNTNTTVPFDVNASTGRYFTLESAAGPGPEFFVEITSLTGSEVSTSAVPQVTVIRIR